MSSLYGYSSIIGVPKQQGGHLPQFAFINRSARSCFCMVNIPTFQRPPFHWRYHLKFQCKKKPINTKKQKIKTPKITNDAKPIISKLCFTNYPINAHTRITTLADCTTTNNRFKLINSFCHCSALTNNRLTC